MHKDVLLLFLSTFRIQNNNLITSTYDGPKGFRTTGVQTNEPVAKYILARSGNLDKIFAFTTPAVKEKIKCQEHAQLSHVELFLQNVFQISAIDALDKSITVDYDERADKEIFFNPVIEMGADIGNYVRGEREAGNTVSVYVDMTGGFRNASMLMLKVMDLLKYNDIAIEQILYTYYDEGTHHGTIKNISDINAITQLISGAEAFVKYGNVDSIIQYFADKKISANLNKLFAAMLAFSDALAICRAGILEKLLAQLKLAIDLIKNEHGNGLEELMFLQLLSVIEREYRPVIFFGADKLDIISWCIKKKFLQQAMTFYTEWVPEYLVQNKIIYFSNHQEEVRCIESKNRNKYVSWQKFMLTDYRPLSSAEAVADKNKINVLRNYFSLGLKKQCETELKIKTLFSQSQELFKRIQQCRLLDVVLVEVKKGLVPSQVLKEKYPILHEILKAVYAAAFDKQRVTFDKYIKHYAACQKILNMVAVMPLETLIKILKIDKADYDIEIKDAKIITLDSKSLLGYTLDSNCLGRTQTINKYILKKAYKSDYDIGQTLAIIENYLIIKKLRNTINHASEEEVALSGSQIQNLLQKNVALIRSVLHRV